MTTLRIGKRKEKAQVWLVSRAGGLWKVLLLKLIPERGAYWQPVTGGVEMGESPKQGALREAWEETGLDPFRAIRPLGFEFEYESRWGKVHEEAFFFEALPECPVPTIDPVEHTDHQWVELADVERHLLHQSHLLAVEKLKSLVGPAVETNASANKGENHDQD